MGCKDLGEEVPTSPPYIPADDLLAVPESVDVEAETLTLSTYLWRSFMPTIPPTNSGLIALVCVRSMDSTQLPISINLNAVWIVNGQQVWRSFLADEDQSSVYRQCKIARNGPGWDGPVEVIVRLFDDRGESHMLRASQQIIDKVY